MRIENVEVFGFRAALRGMRNPMDSWAKSDTVYGTRDAGDFQILLSSVPEGPRIGSNDLQLATSLIRAGGSHRKFMRQIMVWWDITIPRAIWQELDTYKVATVRNSCSTMHKLGHRDLDRKDFEGGEISLGQLQLINTIAAKYRTSRSTNDLHELKMHLPESFLQKATYSFSYETGLKMWFDRKDHRMFEWSGPGGICSWIHRLPYMATFIEAAVKP